MIVIRNLEVAYGKVKVIDGFSATISGITALAGPNGSGKSTLLRAIAGGVKARGFISINQKVVLSESASLPPERRGVAYLPQSGGPIPNLTVLQNLELSGRVESEVVEALGLKGLLQKKVKELSGGQRRKVGVAMVLLSGRKVWLLDEPLAGVDPRSRAEIIEFVRERARSFGATVLWASHLREVLESSDHVIEIVRR